MIGMRRSDQPKRRPAIMLAALLAVLLQALVVPTHVHVFAPPAGAAVAGPDLAAGGAAAHVTAPHEQVSCVLCAVLAASGRAVLAHAAELTSEHLSALAVTLPRVRAPPIAHTHSWRSRAPPVVL